MKELDLSHDQILTRELSEIKHPGPIKLAGQVLRFVLTGPAYDSAYLTDRALDRAKHRYGLEVWHATHNHALEAGLDPDEAVAHADIGVATIEAHTWRSINTSRIE